MTLRAVVDPNVLVSALISPNGVPARILTASEEGRFRLVVSERLVAELQDVLVRPKFRRYATVEEVQAHVRRVRKLGLIYGEGDEFEAVSPDPKDDYLVALSHAADADHLVSGDPHLTGLTGEVAVVTPRAFLDLLERKPRR